MKTLSVALLSVCAIFFYGYEKDPVTPQRTEAEKITKILTSGNGTWTPSATAGVTVDGHQQPHHSSNPSG